MVFEAVSHILHPDHKKDDHERSNEEITNEAEKLRASVGDLAQNLAIDRLTQFLDANGWDHGAAKEQLESTLLWRQEKQVDMCPVATAKNGLPVLVSVRGYKNIQDQNIQSHPQLSETSIRILNYLGGDSFHKFDKEGHPLLIDRTGYHQSKELGNDVTSEEIKHFQVACNEFLNRVIMLEASERAGRPIHKETIIFDCTHMGLWQFHMSGLLKLKQVAEYVQGYYPETLAHLFVVNAPSAFLVMWRIIRLWLDPKTLEKIQILGKDYQDVLLKYVDSESLPDFLGGNCSCCHLAGGCVPSVNEGRIPFLVKKEENEKVPSVYNSDIMKEAKTNVIYRQIVKE
ncbi:CRAL-TRIO domain-containing protein [Halteromyces radiatus]|uniref:CRAL-TRIO domain-containing protein n=1 Tax=Halteromyces radiatus TaxID=101107 RepID=UPI00221E49D2|nr:CRAL-TRIO domain-containing protein [Halteromyces radiatus]KAI8082839.1 CRAL-TRIO domain-containing protein [Halteromyces radiatus]